MNPSFSVLLISKDFLLYCFSELLKSTQVVISVGLFTTATTSSAYTITTTKIYDSWFARK